MFDFVNFVTQTSLMDLGYISPTYTWTNNRLHPFNIKERLDRVLIDPTWRSFYPHLAVTHLPTIGSDHCPILLCTESKRFKRENFPF